MNMTRRSILCCSLMFVVVAAAGGQAPRTAGGQAQRTVPIGDETGRDAVGFRKDKVTKESLGERRAAANIPTTKQAIEDFMEIQKTNKRIQDISKLKPLGLEEIASAAKDLSTRANRLKTSLSLPSVPKEAKTAIAPAASTDDLLERLKELDANIKVFVTNPLFRQISDTSRDLPMEASVSLNKVIGLSKVVEASASKLR